MGMDDVRHLIEGTRPADDVLQPLEGDGSHARRRPRAWLVAMSRAGCERGSAQEESAARSRFHSCGSSSPSASWGASARAAARRPGTLGVDSVCLAGSHQGVEAGEVFARRLVPDEEEVLPAQGGLAQRAFRAVVVQRQSLVVDEAAEGIPLIQRVGDGLSHAAPWRVQRLLLRELGVQRLQHGTALSPGAWRGGRACAPRRPRAPRVPPGRAPGWSRARSGLRARGERVEEFAGARAPNSRRARGPWAPSPCCSPCTRPPRGAPVGAPQHVLGRLARSAHAEAVADEPLALLILGEECPQVAQARLLHIQHAQGVSSAHTTSARAMCCSRRTEAVTAPRPPGGTSPSACCGSWALRRAPASGPGGARAWSRRTWKPPHGP